MGLDGTVWRLYGAVRVWMGLYRAALGLNGALLGCTELLLGRPWCCGGEGTTVSTRQREGRRDPESSRYSTMLQCSLALRSSSLILYRELTVKTTLNVYIYHMQKSNELDIGFSNNKDFRFFKSSRIAPF